MDEIPEHHWTHFLPEVGNRIRRKGFMQLDRGAEIRKKERELQQLKAEFDQEENELTKIAMEDWSIEEITEAKLKTKKS